jgi:anti-sigma factor RsiW
MTDQCRELLKRCSAYLEGELDGVCCEEMERHMQVCPRCSTMLEEMQWTIELCRSTPVQEVPPTVSAALREKLRTTHRGR